MINAGLLRCGKSCRLRWMNYLRPDIKRGNITPDEDDLIIRMHSLLGNRWSLIAGRLPGRTDNEIKNYWNTHLIKKLKNQEQQPEEKKKKKKKQKNEKNKIITKVPEDDSEKKTLVYLPKAIRVNKSLSYIIPRSDSTLNMESNSVKTSQEEKEQREETKEGENDGFGLFFGEQFHEDLVNNNEMEWQSGFLEKLYEEYLQVLKNEENHEKLLDSFAESLLV